jgi:hypothetical protein
LISFLIWAISKCILHLIAVRYSKRELRL